MIRSFALASAAMLFASAPASAQFPFRPGLGGGFAFRGEHHFTMRGPGFSFFSYSRRGFFAAPIMPIYSFGWVGPGFGPGFGNPFFLPPPPFVFGDPIVVAPIFPVVNNAPANDNGGDILPAGARAGEFLVITPRGVVQPEGGTISPAVDRVAARPERPPVFRFDPFAEQRKVGLTEVVPIDPAAEKERHMTRARMCLSKGENGLAIEHLDRARAAKPGDREMLFLKGQAQFAAGNYTDAVHTIQLGIRLDPGWAKSAIQPRQLFGGDRFDRMFVDLKRAFAANPDSAALQFLLAHQLWFDGDREDARKRFQNLEARLKQADVLAPFLATK